MHDEDECDECEEEVLSAPFTAWDLLIAFFAFVSGVFEAASNSTNFLLKSAVGASNRQTLRKQFEEETRAAIESIPVAKDEA